MKPMKFKEVNKNLLKPDNMTEEQCESLWVNTDGIVCVSCWKMSIKQRINALLFGKVWLSVRSGVTQPPVRVDCERTIFQK